MNKPYLAIKADDDPTAFSEKHHYLLNGRPVKNERNKVIFEKPSKNDTENVFEFERDVLDMMTNMKFNLKKN